MDIAEHIHSLNGAYLAGPDVGTGPEDMDFMYRRTRWTGGRSKAAGGAGGTTFGTFIGLLSAITTAIEVSLETSSVLGLRCSVVGLGGIGASLARTLKEQGAELVLSDIDPEKEALAKELDTRWMSPDEAMLLECDLLAPCALGGVFTDENIAKLKCKVICGAANNQLAYDGVAAALLQREIVYVPDFIASAGGLMYVSGDRTESAADKHTRDGIAQNVRTVLQESWYCAGWDYELSLGKDALLARRIAGESIVLYRKPDGAVVAMEDRCCHRQTALSCGRNEGDSLRCMYHGWKFGSDGQCVEIPGQERIPQEARVRSFPVVEKDNWREKRPSIERLASVRRVGVKCGYQHILPWAPA